MRLAWTENFGFAQRYATEDSPEIIDVARAAAQSLARSARPSSPPTRCGRTAPSTAPCAGRSSRPSYEVMVGTNAVPLQEADPSLYREQAESRARNWEHFRDFFKKYDVIMSVTAQRIGAKTDEWDRGLDRRRPVLPGRQLRPRLLQPHDDLQLAGLPRRLGALRLPDGMPVGLQIAAWHGREDLVLRVAQAFQQAFPRAERPARQLTLFTFHNPPRSSHDRHRSAVRRRRIPARSIPSSAPRTSTSTSGGTAPHPHRHVHGGFAGTDTRFTFYFPPHEEWQGRMFQPLEGAHAGHEDAFGGPMGELIGGLAMTARLGGYMCESNSGHIGDDIDQARAATTRRSTAGGPAPSRRASPSTSPRRSTARRRSTPTCGAAAAAAAVHRCAWRTHPTSGTARCRSWAAATSTSPATEEDPRRADDVVRVRCSTSSACSEDKLRRVIDAMRPGGSGNPFDGLDTHQREELAYAVPARFPARRRIHDRSADGPDLALDLDGRRSARPGSPSTSRTSGPSPATSATTPRSTSAEDRIDFHGTVTRTCRQPTSSPTRRSGASRSTSRCGRWSP